MVMAKGDEKRAIKALATARLVLPAVKVRRLVWQIVHAEGVAPFARRRAETATPLSGFSAPRAAPSATV
jgi:uncharacterized membrane protein YfbV (UPF0208 family)